MNRRAVVTTLLVSFTAGALLAETPTREIKHKSQDLEKIKAEMDRKKEEKQKLQQQAADLSTRVKQDQERMKDVEKSLLNTRRRSSEVEQKMAAAKIRHDDLVSRLGEERVALNSAASQYYVAMLLEGPNGIAPVYGRQAIISRGNAVSTIREEATKEHDNLNELVSASTILRTEAQKQENKLLDIKTLRRDREKQLSKTRTRQDVVESELKDLQQSAEQLASLIDTLRTKAKQEAAQEKAERLARQKSGNSPITAHSLPWPLPGKVTTKFGRQTDPKLGSTFISNGIIIETAEKTPVAAVADGKVLYAGEFMGYGAMAVVEHPGDWYSVYGHLSDWVVEKGQQIKRGSQIGRTRIKPGGGTECYFELRFYGKPTDPLPWLARP